MEQHGVRIEHAKQQGECHHIEKRTERPEDKHEPTDPTNVPPRRAAHLRRVDPVGGYGQLAAVVEQIPQKDLSRKHGQEGGTPTRLPR